LDEARLVAAGFFDCMRLNLDMAVLRADSLRGNKPGDFLGLVVLAAAPPLARKAVMNLSATADGAVLFFTDGLLRSSIAFLRFCSSVIFFR
jgi:hypothetical protein